MTNGDGYQHLYCSVCALDAIKQHLRRGPGASPPEFQAVSVGEVQELGGNTWQVPRAHVIFGGQSLCMFHMATALAEELGDTES